MSRKTYSFNTTRLDAIRFLLARDDDLGLRFKEFFKCSISPKYEEQLLQEPFKFSNYNVLNNIRNDCDTFFGTKDWFLCLHSSEAEKTLLSVLKLERELKNNDIPHSKEEAMKDVSIRIYRFKLVYQSCNNKEEVKSALKDYAL